MKYQKPTRENFPPVAEETEKLKTPLHIAKLTGKQASLKFSFN